MSPGATGPGATGLHRRGRATACREGGPPHSTLPGAARRELPDTAHSCEQGFCGSCQQRVPEGEVGHRGELPTDAERAGSVLIGASRARSDRLVLDV